jgi:5-methylcytosine-specific restriction endonuclease McrA
MPWAPLRTCAVHRLRVPRGKRCPACTRDYDRARTEHFVFYTSQAWRTLRAQVLREEPWCRCGCGRPSLDVDHIKPRTTHPALALERSNLRALSRECHGRVTRTQQRLERGDEGPGGTA